MGNHITVTQLKELDHPGLTKLYHIEEASGNIWKVYQMGIPLPCRLTERDCMYLIKDIVSALAYLHNIGLIYLDLKPGNIVMKIQNKLEFMLCDLESINLPDGCESSCELNKIRHLIDIGYIEESYSVDGGITYGYIAPEYLAEESVTTQYDIYALGITIIQLLGIQTTPFTIGDFELEKINDKYIRSYIKAKLTTSNLSDQLKALLLDMINVDPAKRPTANEILSNTLISSLTNDQRPILSSIKLTKALADCIAIKAIQSARRKTDIVDN